MKKISMLAVALECLPQITNATTNDTIIVTATRTAQTADQSLASVSVITRDDIERLQVNSVEQLLKGLSGISVTNSGGAGKSTSIFLRGTEPDHTLILIDGVRVGSATTGSMDLQHIPVELIERIEIVRGPQSSLYGSEAIGGVIQIFTRNHSGKKQSFIRIGGGSYSTHSGAAGTSSAGERGWYNFTVSAIGTDGFNACNGKPSPEGAGCFTTEPDKDGYRNLSGSFRIGYQFTNDSNIDFHLLRTRGDTEYDGEIVNKSESLQSNAGGSIHFMPANYWDSNIALGLNEDTSDNFKDKIRQTTFNTKRDTMSWLNDLTLTQSLIATIGLDLLKDHIDSTTDYAVQSRGNKGLFMQYQWESLAKSLQLSFRWDDNEQFGQHITSGGSWGYELNNRLRFTMSYGTAYKAPTFNELYYPGFGNVDLQPEESKSIEFGLRSTHVNMNWSISLYHTRIDNLIAYDAAISAADNINKAHISGLEATTTVSYAGLTFNTGLTLLYPENQSGGSDHGYVLPHRAQHSLRLDVDNKVGRFTMGATLLAEGKRYDDLANSRELKGYATLSFRTSYSFDKNWKVETNIENLLDKKYETVAFFNQPGRSYYLSLLYQQ